MLDHVQVWTGWPNAAGSTCVATLYDVQEPRLTWRVGGEGGFTCKTPRGDSEAAEGTALRAMADAYAQVRPGRCFRLMLTSGLWHDVRVMDVSDGSGDGMAAVTCGGYSTSLAKTPPVQLTLPGGKTTFTFDGVGLSPEQQIETYLKPQWEAIDLPIAIGVIVPTQNIDVPYDNDTDWSALQKIEELTASEVWFRDDLENGVTYLDLVPNDGTTIIEDGHEVDANGNAVLTGGFPSTVATFGDVLTDVEGPRLSVGFNSAIRRIRSEVEQRTRLYGSAALGVTIAEATWEVVSEASDIVILGDPAGGPGPILVDDQLNGLYLEAADRTTRSLISDSSADDQSVSVADGSVFTPGDRVRIRAGSDGTKLNYLEDPAEVATHGVISGVLARPDIPETVNLMVNADQSSWSGSSSDPADGWLAVGAPTLTRTTTAAHKQIGPYSCRVETNADGEGYASPLVDVVPTAENPYGSGFLSFKLVSGKVRVELVATDGVDVFVYPDGVSQKATTTALGVFVQAGVAGAINFYTNGITAVRMRIVQDGPGSAEFYVDAGQVTESAGQLPLVIGAGPTQLWQAINNELALSAPTRVRYEGQAIDFFRKDPANYATHKLIRGVLHTVDDASLGVVDGVRLLEMTQALDAETNTSVVLSSLPSDLRSLRERKARPRRNSASMAGVIAAEHAGARVLYDFNTTNADETATSTSADFTAADVGKTLWVYGAGASGAILKTTVDTVTDEDEIEMADAASATLTNTLAILGTPEGVLTLAGSVGGGTSPDPTEDPFERWRAEVERRFRELGQNGTNGTDGVDGGGELDLSSLEAVHWTEAQADMSGAFAYAEALDFEWGYPIRMTGAWQGDSTSLIFPTDGLYHFSAGLRLDSNSGTAPEELEFYVYPEDHEDTDYILAYLYADESDGSTPSATTGRLEFTVHMRAGERLVFEIASDTSDDAYEGGLTLSPITVQRIGDLSVAQLAPPTFVGQNTANTTTTQIRVTWSVGVSAAEIEIRLNGNLEVDTTSASPFDVTGLSAGTEYVPTARHLKDGNESVWRKFTSLWTKPSPPNGITLTVDSATAITVEVDPAHATASTRVRRGGVTVHTMAPGETTWQDTGLSPSTSYTYELHHSTPGGLSATGVSDSATTDP